MHRLFAESYLLLVRVDFEMRFGNLKSIHALVRRTEITGSRTIPAPTAQELCQAIDLACVFYVKRVLCLQRSAATTLLLKRYGHRAEMVIGTQLYPFRSHAWVEIDGAVVNDKPYMLDIYQVLDRC